MNIFTKIIPQLVVFKTLNRMKGIKEGKRNLFVKEVEKLQDQGCEYSMAVSKANGTWREPEPENPEPIEIKDNKGRPLAGYALEKALEELEIKKKEEEAQREKDEEERKAKEDWERWGRYWTWENYFNPEVQPHWEEAATALMRINDHVLQDIEDAILLQAFYKMDQKAVNNIINEHKEKRRQYDIILHGVPEDQDFKGEDDTRNFLNRLMRPPMSWNFFEEDGSIKTPHVLRADAQPQQCYIDGRVEVIMEHIQALGSHLTQFDSDEWDHIVESAIQIFRDAAAKELADFNDAPR